MRRFLYYLGFSFGVFTLLLSGGSFMMGMLAQGFGNSDGLEIAFFSACYFFMDLMFLWSLRKVVYQYSTNIYEKKVFFFSATVILISSLYLLWKFIQDQNSSSPW